MLPPLWCLLMVGIGTPLQQVSQGSTALKATYDLGLAAVGGVGIGSEEDYILEVTPQPGPGWILGLNECPVDTALGLHFSLSRCLLTCKHSSGCTHTLFPLCFGENWFKPLYFSWVAG